jgi:nucleotide-binding universal stress UspA family protein
MKILFACDEHPYSSFALKEAIHLAYNTWADITILGVIPSLLSTSTPVENHQKNPLMNLNIGDTNGFPFKREKSGRKYL